MRRIAAITALFAVAAGVLVLTTTSATAATCTGTGIVQVNSFAFNPPAINAGQSSTATLVAQNCTPTAISPLVTWAARYVGAGTGIPPGCLAIDPVANLLAVRANGQGSTSLTVPYVLRVHCDWFCR